jgi:hypothetical protein
MTVNDSEAKLELDTSQRYNIIDLSKYTVKGMNTVKLFYPESKGGLRFYIEICP